MQKRGISTVVATVLIILISVAAVAIIWAVVIPMIRNSLGVSDVCMGADISVDVSSGYTCYNPSLDSAYVQVKKGAGSADISKIQFLFSSAGNSVEITKDNVPGKNSAITYDFGLTEELGLTGKIESVSVAPFVRIGDTEKMCEVSSKVKIPLCSGAVSDNSGTGDGECAPDCVEKACGADDGCGDICLTGTCPVGQTCNGNGGCVATGIEINSSDTFPYQLSQEGGNYYLSSSLALSTTAFNVTADNITLDCKGKNIVGSSYYGIYNKGHNFLTIKNCTFQSFSPCVYFEGSTGNTVQDSTFLSCASSGIKLNTYVNNTIIKNNIFSQSGNAIYYLYGGDSNSFLNNKINGGSIGIYITYGAVNSTILGNDINGTTSSGIKIESPHSYSIRYNNITNFGSYGIWLYGSDSAANNNKIEYNKISSPNAGAKGISADGSGNIFNNNNLCNVPISFYCSTSTNTFYENVCTNPASGNCLSACASACSS